MVRRPQREKLSGAIEVDETYVGGEKPCKRGKGAEGKGIVVIAAERDKKGIGRIRLAHIPDITSEALEEKIESLINARSMIITDGWRGYSGLSKKGYGHQELCSYDGIGDGHATELPSCRKFAQTLDHGIASRGISFRAFARLP